ncbi:hypothetical protein P4K96_23235, partial [Bacillus cereus]|nr:hypothetical protein [Bacillus cereus]
DIVSLITLTWNVPNRYAPLNLFFKIRNHLIHLALELLHTVYITTGCSLLDLLYLFANISIGNRNAVMLRTARASEIHLFHVFVKDAALNVYIKFILAFVALAIHCFPTLL